MLPNVFDMNDVRRAYGHLVTVNGSFTDRPEVVGERNQTEPWANGKPSRQKRVAKTVRDYYWKKGCRASYLGFMDRKGRFKYCRQTAWTIKHPEVLSNSWPLIYSADREFKEHLPDAHKRQLFHIADAPYHTLGNTAFTTLTVNKKLSTTYHRDEGDYLQGFGVMFTLGEFEGGQLVFPAFRCAVDYKPGSMILADVHETHGNVDNIFGDRVTCVLYARNRINECGTDEDEEERMAGTMSIYVRED